MSYIRALSNPEGLYVWGSADNNVHIARPGEALWVVDRDEFHGFIRRWGELFFGITEPDDRESDEDVVMHGRWVALYAPHDGNNEWKWRLSHEQHGWFDVWEVTLIALYATNKHRWEERDE